MHHDPSGDDGGRPDVLEASIATVLRILDGMGIAEVSEDAVLAAPPFYDGPVLLQRPGSFSHFAGQLAVHLRFVGYPLEDVAFLGVRQLGEMYVRDSFPPIPSVPLSEDQYELDTGSSSRGTASGERDFPICFVLGAPRSGTTLLRAMLDQHAGLWAPGELHLANFETMADRASNVRPILRYLPIPEAASRCGESIAAFSRTFQGWELGATPVAEVFQSLHDAAPDVMIVDKTPPYCAQLGVLERIGRLFPNATFVHLIRSPHDVIRSYVRLQLHRGDRRPIECDRNPYQIGEATWASCNSNTEAFLSGIPAERKCAIRYEDLVRDPAEALGAVCELLGQTFDPRMADPYGAASGAIARGAGDLHIHLFETVENRRPIDPFYPLGTRAQRLCERYGYRV